MPTAFSRTTRSLSSDGALGVLAPVAVGALLLGAWGAWFFEARVGVYESSADARVEVSREVHPLSAAAAGKVVATRLKLGAQVEAGEVLVELDSEGERRRLAEEQQRLAGLRPQLEAVGREIAQDRRSLDEDLATTRFSLEAARAHQQAAVSQVKYAAGEADRLTRLLDAGAASKVDLLRAETDEEQRQAGAAAAGADLGRVEGERRTRESRTLADIEALERDQARISGDIATAEAQIHVLEQELEKHRLRAPIGGEIGEIASLQVGSVLREGERVAAIVPAGEVHAVAHFPASAALGRLRPGQPAELRLDGFPWTEFGVLHGRVAQVASEPDERGIRVELTIDPDPASRIPLRHGLPGVVQIEVERASPAALLLRAAGRLGSNAISDSPSNPNAPK